MSIELHVLSDRRLASTAEWQQAVDAEGFALVFCADAEFGDACGFFPAVLKETPSGFELYHDDARELMEAYADIVAFDHEWRHALGFRWSGHEHEGISAFMAATAYARATGGVVFDPQEGKVITPDESREIARQWEQQNVAG
jgi:hypothetical protein